MTKWADLYISGSGQWSSQTQPLAAPGERSAFPPAQFGSARARFLAGGRDRFDVVYTGSRVNLSSGGLPAGFEALVANPMAPQFAAVGGFAGEPEADQTTFLQAGWIHVFGAGILESKVWALRGAFRYEHRGGWSEPD